MIAPAASTRVWQRLGSLCALAALWGCSAQDKESTSLRASPGVRDAPAQAAAGSAATMLPMVPVAPSSPAASQPTLIVPAMPTVTTTVNPASSEMCATTSAMAPPPVDPRVDIVWIVDASGSMLDEQMKIAANLAAFADAITSANIDVRIVMMTTSAAIPVICPVTAPDPLTGTALASDPRYKFIESLVSSTNPLDVAVDNFGMYSSFLRPGAATHFVIVTDDESTYRALGTPEERATSFLNDMRGLLGRDFTLHTVSSEGPVACRDPNCNPDPETGICVFVMLGCGAARPGTTYYNLAAMTKGLSASICASDWKTIFEPLTAAVIASAPLPCTYMIPPPPSGDTLDPSKVNVRWQATGAGSEMIFGKTSDQAACMGQLGWYYDADPPAQILLCPATCDAIAAGGTLSIGFGCATVELK
jgi:hypothetical protein